jgi:hypothetical protein
METNYRHSEAMDQIADALCKAQGTMAGAKKESINPHFNRSYADLESVWDACRKPLSENGLAVFQPVSADGPRVVVSTVLTHKSGQWIASDLTITAAQNTPQGIGSAITYGRRYGLSAMVGIAPEEDDDGNDGSGRGNDKPASKPPRPPTPPPPPKAPAPTGPAPKKEYDHFKALATVSDMKNHVGETTYRRILGAHGYLKANEIKTREEMTKVYTELAAEAQRMKESNNAA